MDILTPCHQMPIQIIVCGNGYEVDEIYCPADKCYNSWDKQGFASPYNNEC